MASHIYPDNPGNLQADPLRLTGPAGTDSDLLPIPSLHGIDAGDGRTGRPDTIFIRIAQTGADGTPKEAAPLFLLQADGGVPVEVPAGRTVPVWAPAPDGEGRRNAGCATYTEEAAGLFLILVFLKEEAPGSAWTLRLRKADGGDSAYVWAVADSDADAQQPWIDVVPQGAPLTLRAQPGQTAKGQLTFRNLGTGPLVLTAWPKPFIDDLKTAIPGDHQADLAPAAIPPLGRFDAGIQFTPAASPIHQPFTRTYQIDSNDALAKSGPGGHSRSASFDIDLTIPAPTFVAAGSQITPAKASPGQYVTLHGHSFTAPGLKVQLGRVPTDPNAPREVHDVSLVGNATDTEVVVQLPADLPLSPPYDAAFFFQVATVGGTAVTDDRIQITPLWQAPAFAAKGGQVTPTQARPGDAVTLHGQNFAVPGLKVRIGLEGLAAPQTLDVAPLHPPTDAAIDIALPDLPVGTTACSFTVTTVGGTATTDDRLTPLLPARFDTTPFDSQNAFV